MKTKDEYIIDTSPDMLKSGWVKTGEATYGRVEDLDTCSQHETDIGYLNTLIEEGQKRGQVS